MLTNRFANILKMSNNFEKTSFHKDPKVYLYNFKKIQKDFYTMMIQRKVYFLFIVVYITYSSDLHPTI